jgi:outer membrane biosynthesis protein TonB
MALAPEEEPKTPEPKTPEPKTPEPKTPEPKTSEPPRPTPWIVEIKRYKKLNYRFGSAQLYDDSETVEAIRARERGARGGGYVLNVYREYDWEGNALNSKTQSPFPSRT